MTYQEALAQINTWIVANGNNEITGPLLNEVLQAILQAAEDTTGSLDDLATTDQTNLVAALNEVLQVAESSGGGNVVRRWSGTANPNVTPPSSFNTADFYVQVNGVGLPLQIYQFNGLVWLPVGASSTTDLSYNAETGEVSNSNGTGFTIPVVTSENIGLATPEMLAASQSVNGQIVQYGTIEVVDYGGGEFIAFMSGWEVIINGQLVTQFADPSEGGLYPASEGKYRVNRIVMFDYSGGQFQVLGGVESDNAAIPPDQPANTVTIGFIYWYGDQFTTQPTSEGFITKLSRQANWIYADVDITELPRTQLANYVINGGVEQIQGLAGTNSAPETDQPYEGLEFWIYNNTDHNIKLWHNGDGTVPFLLPNEDTLIVPPKCMASFVIYGNLGGVVFKSLSAVGAAANSVRGRIVQYGVWDGLALLSVWYDYKILFGDTVVDVIPDSVDYSYCATGYTRYDRVEVDSDGVVSLVTGVESTGFPDKPAPTAGKVTIGFMQISDSSEYWLPVSEGFVSKDSQQVQAVYGTGAVTLPVTGSFNYTLQAGVTQVDDIDPALPSSPELNSLGQDMKIINGTGGDVTLKHGGRLFFQNGVDFTLPAGHVATFFYESTGSLWVFSGSSVQGGGSGPRVPRIVYASTEYGAEITGTGNQIIHAFKFSPDTHPTKPGDKITVRITMTKTGTSDSVPMYIFHNDTVNLAGADQFAQATHATGVRAPFLKRTFELQADGYIDMASVTNNANSDEGVGTAPRARLQVWDYDGDNYLLIVVNRSGTSDTLYPTGYEVEIK